MVAEFSIFTQPGCPKCVILKKKLQEKGIVFFEEEDIQEIQEQNFKAVPVLKIKEWNGKITYLSFEDSISFLKEAVVQ